MHQCPKLWKVLCVCTVRSGSSVFSRFSKESLRQKMKFFSFIQWMFFLSVCYIPATLQGTYSVWSTLLVSQPLETQSLCFFECLIWFCVCLCVYICVGVYMCVCVHLSRCLPQNIKLTILVNPNQIHLRHNSEITSSSFLLKWLCTLECLRTDYKMAGNCLKKWYSDFCFSFIYFLIQK